MRIYYLLCTILFLLSIDIRASCIEEEDIKKYKGLLNLVDDLSERSVNSAQYIDDNYNQFKTQFPFPVDKQTTAIIHARTGAGKSSLIANIQKQWDGPVIRFNFANGVELDKKSARYYMRRIFNELSFPSLQDPKYKEDWKVLLKQILDTKASTFEQDIENIGSLKSMMDKIYDYFASKGLRPLFIIDEANDTIFDGFEDVYKELLMAKGDKILTYSADSSDTFVKQEGTINKLLNQYKLTNNPQKFYLKPISKEKAVDYLKKNLDGLWQQLSQEAIDEIYMASGGWMAEFNRLVKTIFLESPGESAWFREGKITKEEVKSAAASIESESTFGRKLRYYDKGTYH